MIVRTLPPPQHPANPKLPAAPTPEVPRPDSDRICTNSVNFRGVNPDAAKTQFLSCACGRRLSIGQDWYTEIYDGTLVCWICSACHRCGLACGTGCRRLVSISGYVLCYNCVRHYGETRAATWQPKVVPFRGPLLAMKRQKTRAAARTARPRGGVSGGGGGPSCPAAVAGTVLPAWNNLRFFSNCWQTQRSPECRRVLRNRDYPCPERPLPTELDPQARPVGHYTAMKAQFDRMTCPACWQPATKKGSIVVVPAISRVYHSACFLCFRCRTPLARFVLGAPGKHYVFCTCDSPVAWCTQSACARARLEHHQHLKCQLEPIHPGGRHHCETVNREDPPPVAALGRDASRSEKTPPPVSTSAILSRMPERCRDPPTFVAAARSRV